MTAVRVHVTGTVQGVGFRWFTRDLAESHHVTGWVRNRQDGSVEAELHGAEEDVAAVLRALHDGPPGAVVRQIASEPFPASSSLPNGFEILPTE